MITAKTRKIALIGYPIDHSKSPEMINHAFSYMGEDMIYTAFNVKHRELGRAVMGLRTLGFEGFNVTTPHKVEIIKYLDELDVTALEIGAVNTVMIKNEKLIGYNTDGIGYLRSLKEETGLCVSSQRVMILGAGGAARSVGWVLAKEGVRQITFANRDIFKAEQLAQGLSGYVKTDAIALSDYPKRIGDITLLINATPVGMYPNIAAMPISDEHLHSQLIVSDLVYNPKHTALVKAAHDRGAMVHYGLGMLVHQAAVAIEIWTGTKAPSEVMRKTLEESGLSR